MKKQWATRILKGLDFNLLTINIEIMDKKETMEQLIAENFYEYIRTKAKKYLDIGFEKYRKQDAFSMPPDTMIKESLIIYARGCKQVVDYKGLTPETPFEGLRIPGFYQLMELFHFKVVKKQIAKMMPGNGILDEMHMEHTVTGRKMKLYNLVSPESKSTDRAACTPNK